MDQHTCGIMDATKLLNNMVLPLHAVTEQATKWTSETIVAERAGAKVKHTSKL